MHKQDQLGFEQSMHSLPNFRNPTHPKNNNFWPKPCIKCAIGSWLMSCYHTWRFLHTISNGVVPICHFFIGKIFRVSAHFFLAVLKRRRLSMRARVGFTAFRLYLSAALMEKRSSKIQQLLRRTTIGRNPSAPATLLLVSLPAVLSLSSPCKSSTGRSTFFNA